MIFGHVSIHQHTWETKGQQSSVKGTLAVISRRSVWRAGTRFNRRGLDGEGRAANFVETEQVWMSGDRLCSLVQVRGSAPCFWQQYANARLRPPITLRMGYTADDHARALEKHLDALRDEYGENVACLDLLDHHGSEEALRQCVETLFDSASLRQRFPGASYQAFDFHHECRGLQFQNAGRLGDEMAERTAAVGHFEQASGRIVARQNGVLRVNCLDSLDRSGVVMAQAAQRFLLACVASWPGCNWAALLQDPVFRRDAFSRAWADTADALSLQYAGSLALKNDFTRSGARTRLGVWRDMASSMRRYFHVCFLDGVLQDAFDLFLGRYVPSHHRPHRPDQLEERGQQMSNTLSLWKSLAFHSVLLLLSLLLVAYLLAPVGNVSGCRTSSVLFWLVLAAACLHITASHPEKVIQSPALLLDNLHS